MLRGEGPCLPLSDGKPCPTKGGPEWQSAPPKTAKDPWLGDVLSLGDGNCWGDQCPRPTPRDMPQQVLPWSDSQLSKPAGYIPQEKRNWLRVLIRALSSEACTLVGAVLAADEPGESLCTKSKAREAGPWPWMVMLSPWNWAAKLISSSSLCDEGP